MCFNFEHSNAHGQPFIGPRAVLLCLDLLLGPHILCFIREFLGRIVLLLSLFSNLTVHLCLPGDLVLHLHVRAKLLLLFFGDICCENLLECLIEGILTSSNNMCFYVGMWNNIHKLILLLIPFSPFC